MDKAIRPDLSDVEKRLPNSYPYWKELIKYVYENYPEIKEEWTYSGKSYGWAFRIRSKKRVVLYFSPLESCLRLGFALGQKATDAIHAHRDIPLEIKKQLLEAKPYREGRPLRIEINNPGLIDTIKEIIKVKMDH